jgi:hypothetical protein
LFSMAETSSFIAAMAARGGGDAVSFFSLFFFFFSFLASVRIEMDKRINYPSLFASC